ncbi:hypothetical protein cypCar_00020215 [Cyprinus carpio]|nr:hypothetical protein cypCar_00020215 [Cyprinus carpio]
MAESSISVAQGQFNCSICLDLLKDPVTLNCGHSYCKSCITGCWDQDDQKGVYSCPQCRQVFTPRPVLGKNTMLAEVVENLRKRKLQTIQLDDYYGKPGDGECDVCTEEKNKAIKSCLVCLESYCQNHFEHHEEFHSKKRHKMTDATVQLREMICTLHDRLLEMYCRTDQCCICVLCMLDEHKKHETVSPAEERTEKQKLLEETQRTFQQKIQEKETELEELRETVESHKSFQSYNVPPAPEKSSSIAVSSCLSFDDLIFFFSQLEEKLQHVFKEEEEKIFRRVRYIEMIPTPEYESRDEFLQHYQRITLDRNTAHEYLKLSEWNRVVTNMNENQSYWDNSDRFDHKYQVLSNESLNGRCYWEVERKGSVYISVSYKSISRKGRGRKCEFGSNDCSWSLTCSNYSCSFFHSGISITLPVSSSSRIGVYADQSAGTLSFYSVSDTMTLIHRVHTTFTQPLYAGFWVYYNAQVELCDPAT